jgi:hypothetical protein
MRRLVLLLPAALLAGCNPTAEDVESALVSRGFGTTEAACVGRELAGRLSERQWRAIAEVAGDTMRTDEEWRDMTVGEIGDKLTRVGDPQLIGTLLRAGMGCALLGGERRERVATF